MNILKTTIAAAAAVLFGAAGAHAVTLSSETPPLGLEFGGSEQIVSGASCADNTVCWKLNQTGDNFTISAISPATFNLTAFFYGENGANTSVDVLGIFANGDPNFEDSFDVEDTYTVNLVGLTSITFTKPNNNGTVEIGGVDITVFSNVVDGQVPLPAAGFLLIGGLGGLAALKRRRKAA